MKTIILSAGQGTRLLPLTAEIPKCALPIYGKTVLEWQVDELLKSGIDDVVVVTGFGTEKVEQLLARRYDGLGVRTVFNPFFKLTDNLATCWVVRNEMEEDFILLNGDTLFDTSVLKSLLASRPQPITVTIDKKASYDDDDMKVMLDGDRLVRIGKDLPPDKVDAESIGLLFFRGAGATLFQKTIEQVLRTPEGTKRWYLSVINELAQTVTVGTCCIEGSPWAEIDFPADLQRAEEVVRGIAERWRMAEAGI
jgi:choline kinase